MSEQTYNALTAYGVMGAVIWALITLCIAFSEGETALDEYERDMRVRRKAAIKAVLSWAWPVYLLMLLLISVYRVVRLAVGGRP